LPKSFTHLKHLEILNLSYNQFTTIPLGVTGLYKLRELSLQANDITELASEFFASSHLEWLDLRENPLSDNEKQIIRSANGGRIKLWLSEADSYRQ
jgi:Leucine-rich repeat (LRR) protein